MREKSTEMITIKQNSISNDILRNFNCIRDIDNGDINSLGAYEIQTERGTLQMEIEPFELEKIQRKLKYSNLKKLFLYFLYRMNMDNKRTFNLDLNELLDFKGQARRTENIKRLLDDLKELEKIKVTNYQALINNKECQLKESFLFKCEKWVEESSNIYSYFSVTAGAWAKPLLNNNHYAFIPRDIFTFNKLEIDIAYNIILRFINERSDLINNSNKFSLSVKSVLKNVELNTHKYGSTKMIDKIERVLDKLEELGWFSWDYRKSDRTQLPGRNKLRCYKKFMIDFNCKYSTLIKSSKYTH